MKDLHIDGLKHPIRGRVYENDKIVDIKDIIVNSNKDIKFISADDSDMEFCLDDFIYFVAPCKVFRAILDEVHQYGLEAGRKMKQRPEPKEEPKQDKTQIE